MPVIDATLLRKTTPQIVCIGSHPGIIQSILDFDHLLGRSQPSIVGIIAGGRRSERYFFGDHEVLLPVYGSAQVVPTETRQQSNLFITLTSGRRVLASITELMEHFPNIIGGTIFAERVPERHALELAQLADKHNVWIVGGSSVGLLLPGHLKLSAIGGVEARQMEVSNLFDKGQVAVISSSGGMVNEIIRTVAQAGHGVSMAIALGGERFPVTTPEEACLAALKDPATKAIVYFGELGGDDEYRLAEVLSKHASTKPVVAYIAGAVSAVFETPPQFGHAKAMAASSNESAVAKAEVLRKAGVSVGKTYGDFVQTIHDLPLRSVPIKIVGADRLANRKKSLISSSISYDKDDEVHILNQDLLSLASGHSFAYIAGSMLLGKPLRAPETEAFIDFILKILVDHGPYVSGAVNTIVTARAGRDLVSSLAAGLLTIGPRFGGAINQSAATWIKGVRDGYTPAALVEEFASRKQYMSGIGHRKYRTDIPDPRVGRIIAQVSSLDDKRFMTFATGVEKETTAKKSNLILNVDGAIAASLLDLLHEKEGYSMPELEALVQQEFFNSLFILSRTVGFMAHYFDQVRIDEGIFRLGTEHVTRIE